MVLGLRLLGFLVVGLLVSWLLVSWFETFLVSWLQSFKKSVAVFKRDWHHITKLPFHVLEEIDLISKIFKILVDGSSGFVGACRFEHFQSFGYPAL